MKCDEFENRIHDLLDRRTDIESDDRLLEHAQQCEDCQAVLNAYLNLEAGLNAFDLPELGDDFAHQIMRQATGVRPKSPRSAGHAWIAVAIAASLLIAVTLFLSRPVSHAPPLEPQPLTTNHPPDNNDDSAAPTPSPADQLQPWPETGPLASIASGEMPLDWQALWSEERLGTVTKIAGGIKPITSNLSAALHAIRSTIPLGRERSADAGVQDSVGHPSHFLGSLPS